MASVGKHIRQFRTARHLTQEQLAETLFVTRQTVSAWETGKAQPDLETLERIAAALDAEVTEVIYGVRPAQNLGPLKRRWALIGGGLVMILAIIFIILLENGTYGTWRHGLAYQFTNADYALAYEEIPGSQTLELDLTDLESNVGTVLYEDESGCRILVDAVDENRPGEYRVWFRAHGVYDRAGGRRTGLRLPVPARGENHVEPGSLRLPDGLSGRAGLPLLRGGLQRPHLPGRELLRLPPQSPGPGYRRPGFPGGPGHGHRHGLRSHPAFHPADLLLGGLLIFPGFSRFLWKIPLTFPVFPDILGKPL